MALIYGEYNKKIYSPASYIIVNSYLKKIKKNLTLDRICFIIGIPGYLKWVCLEILIIN